MKMFLVGGAVRDKLMGRAPKDFDFSVVLDESSDLFVGKPDGTFNFFESMKANLIRSEGVQFFDGADAAEHFTAKGKFPKGHMFSGLVAEFVLARKEGSYRDGRRPDSVQPGTLQDDLARRDFTMNAIAQDMAGNFIDPFDGQKDISDGVIRAVGSAKDRLTEDALRALRALRFSIQLDFGFDMDLIDALHDVDVFYALRDNISDERKMDELNKMLKIDTLRTLTTLQRYNKLLVATLDGNVNLMATMKQKGFQ